jgi:hypothetical protein
VPRRLQAGKPTRRRRNLSFQGRIPEVQAYGQVKRTSKHNEDLCPRITKAPCGSFDQPGSSPKSKKFYPQGQQFRKAVLRRVLRVAPFRPLTQAPKTTTSVLPTRFLAELSVRPEEPLPKPKKFYPRGQRSGKPDHQLLGSPARGFHNELATSRHNEDLCPRITKAPFGSFDQPGSSPKSKRFYPREQQFRKVVLRRSTKGRPFSPHSRY